MSNVPVISFNAGQLSPQIEERTDIAKYSSGCRDLENFIPRVYGSAEQRPGTAFIGTAKNSGQTVRMEDFSYSDTIAYMCEFGEEYIRFYYNSGRVVGSTSPTAWATATAYVMGQFTTYSGTIYRCLVAHTSSSGAGDGAGGEPDTNYTEWVTADLDSNSAPICETPTPYQEGDLLELQIRQVADTMWIIHKNYQPRKLTRTSTTTFDLSKITVNDGPFKKRNDLAKGDSVTLTPSATTGTITLTASSATFTANHIGALFKIKQPRATTYVSGTSTHPGANDALTSAISVKGEFSFNTHGTWDKVVSLQRNVNSEGWETYRTWISKSGALRNVSFTDTEEESGVQYRAYLGTSTSGTVYCDINVHDSTQDGICRVTGFTSSTVVTATVLQTFASTSASYRWYEGAWSDEAGWPGAFTFFDERAVYGGTDSEPQNIWFSASGDYEDFDEGIFDDDAFWLTLGSDKRNGIRWLSGLNHLCAGTNGGEWIVRATSLDEKITPTNYTARQQTSYGSKKIQPLQVGDSVLFVDFVGRKIREYTLSQTSPEVKYVAPDLTALAEDITVGGITSIAFQKNPDLIVWCTLATGGLLSMVYEREQNVIAWSKHPLGGTSASCDSVAVIPGTNEDEVWICVSKTVNSATVRHIEQLQPRVSVAYEDSWYVDDGLGFDGGAAQTITGATKANPCVITVASHGLSNGDHVYITGVGGMTDLNGNYYTVDDVTTNTFTLRTYEKYT